MSLTIDEIPAMKAWAAERGLTFRFDAIMTPADDRSMRPVDYQLSPEAILELDQTLDPGLEGRKEFFATYGRPPADNKVYKCGAGRTSMHVNVHGGVSTCVTSRQTVGNLFEQPFEEVWGALGGKVEKRFADGHPCATCKFRSMCAGCPATVEQMTGLPDGYVQKYCKITHLRAQAMGVHATGIPRTVTEGIPHGIAVPQRATRALPVLN
jgi:radical SAM protein with 4Fe4S-binding SPASM domain